MQVAYLDGLRQRTFPTPSDTLTSSLPLHSFLVYQHSSCGWMCGTWLASWSFLLSMDFCRVPLFPCLRPQLPVYRIGARWGPEWACCIVLYLCRESLFLFFRQGCGCDDHCIILFFPMFQPLQFLSIIVRRIDGLSKNFPIGRLLEIQLQVHCWPAVAHTPSEPWFYFLDAPLSSVHWEFGGRECQLRRNSVLKCEKDWWLS